MNNKIFSGLEDLGFGNTSELNIYNEKVNDKSTIDNQKTVESFLYERTVTCPVCNREFKALSVKSSAYRMIKKDSDFFIYYSTINPYFYDVWICNECGYAAMKSDFQLLKEREREIISQNITPKWHGREYPKVYDVNIAIERYKLSLLNYVVLDSKASKKAITCLKLAWMYRISQKDDAEEMEFAFIKEALKGLSYAYYNEIFPIYGMDKYTSMYLIGELSRRIHDYENALIWFSNVVTAPGVKSKLKDLARDQKDLAKEAIDKLNAPDEDKNDTEKFDISKKQTFLSKLFK